MSDTPPRQVGRAEAAIAKFDTPQRVSLAKEKIKKVVDRTSELLALAEHNALIVYSPILSKQIPRSYAANAFNVFQKAMHRQEIVQLCALWDRPDETLAHNSLLTVHALIDDAEVVEVLAGEVSGFWGSSSARVYQTEDDPLADAKIKAMVAERNAKTGQQEADKARAALEGLRNQIPDVAFSPLFASVRNMRDKHLAHALDSTRAEKKGGPLAPMKYGDEQKLLTITMEVVESLYLWITGTHFDLQENRQMQGRYVRELWSNCTFSIEER